MEKIRGKLAKALAYASSAFARAATIERNSSYFRRCFDLTLHIGIRMEHIGGERNTTSSTNVGDAASHMVKQYLYLPKDIRA